MSFRRKSRCWSLSTLIFRDFFWLLMWMCEKVSSSISRTLETVWMVSATCLKVRVLRKGTCKNASVNQWLWRQIHVKERRCRSWTKWGNANWRNLWRDNSIRHHKLPGFHPKGGVIKPSDAHGATEWKLLNFPQMQYIDPAESYGPASTLLRRIHVDVDVSVS